MMMFMMLPDDLVLNCLARVSRLYYPTLSLVCKRFRFVLGSLELYQTRTLLGCTESCLYVCLQFKGDSNPTRWFTLSRKQTQIAYPKPKRRRWFTPFFAPYRFLMDLKKEENVLISVPTRNSPFLDDWCGYVTVGYSIYKIGGCPFSSRVFSLDCRSHTWCEAPNMQVARKYPFVSVVDGKIYVGESNKNSDSSIECFDPKTLIWEHVPRPDPKIYKHYVFLTIEGKLYLFWNNSIRMVYKPKENRWEEVGIGSMEIGSMEVPFANWVPSSTCVIGNVLFSYRWSDILEWYDFEGRCWGVLKGVDKLYILSKGSDHCTRLVDYGGKIAVLWEKEKGEERMIWCAEISLERRNNNEIYGKIEWCDVVLTVPISRRVMKVLAVTV